MGGGIRDFHFKDNSVWKIVRLRSQHPLCPSHVIQRQLFVVDTFFSQTIDLLQIELHFAKNH